MKLNKRKAICCFFICALILGLITCCNTITGRLWISSISFGLDNVWVSSNCKDQVVTTYTVHSSNFEDLSYDEMLELNEALSNHLSFLRRLNYNCNGNLYECSNRSREIEKNGIEVYSDYENSEAYREVQEKEAERAQYRNQYPYVGMREEFLQYTILGKPNEIEKCRNFEHYRSTRKTKTYTWYETQNHGRWEVTVVYAKYKSSIGRYEEYPTNNGVVGYITYNKKGEAPVTVYE